MYGSLMPKKVITLFEQQETLESFHHGTMGPNIGYLVRFVDQLPTL